MKLFYARDFRALMLKYGRTALLADLVAANGNGNGSVTTAPARQEGVTTGAAAAPR